MDFSSAFLLAKRRFGEDTASLRLDGFKTRDRTFIVADNNNERGWALTAAWRHRLFPHADLLLEVQHISSNRPARSLTKTAAKQEQNIAQAGLRLSF